MGFKERLESDLATFFNATEFGEIIQYNEQENIVAIINRLKFPTSTARGVANMAIVFVQKSQVPIPNIHDPLVFDGMVWLVKVISRSDENVWKLECQSKEGMVF
jgi:hypothetical protein